MNPDENADQVYDSYKRDEWFDDLMGVLDNWDN